MKVIKRDNRKVNFNKQKIIDAIKMASESEKVEVKITDEEVKRIALFVEESLKDKEFVNVDEIHNFVIEGLKKENKIEIANEYIDCRVNRDIERYKKLPINKKRKEKADGKNNEMQNANVDETSFGGRKGESHSVEDKEDALNEYMSPKFAKLHRDNISYIHDLSDYKYGDHNCLSVPIDDMLNRTTYIKNSDLRKSGRLSTFMSNSSVVLQTQSQEQFGGVSLTHLDFSASPYFRKSFYKHFLIGIQYFNHTFKKFHLDNPEKISIDSKIYKKFRYRKAYKYAMEMTIEECNQSCEALYHNLNTLLSRSGNQLPFSSVNFGKDTSIEGRIINKSLHKISMDGIGEFGRTSIFPCQIFQWDSKVNGYKGTPNYDLFMDAIESTVHRLYPNYANCDWSVQKKGILKDRQIKQEVIVDLKNNENHKYNELVEIIKNNSDIGKKINLYVKDNDLYVSFEVNPAEDMSTMGCRTYNGFDINFDKDYFNDLLNVIIETKEIPNNYLLSAMQKDGRGNIAPCTIILPTVAMLAKKKSKKNNTDIEVEFLSLLEKYINDTKDELIERFEFICSQSSKSAPFMYRNNTMKGYKEEEGIRSALKHGTLAIGQLGLAECLQILIGCDHTEEKGMVLAKKIEKLFNDKCNEYKHEIYYTEPSNEQIINEMVKKFELKNGKSITSEELSEIEKFVNEK